MNELSIHKAHQFSLISKHIPLIIIAGIVEMVLSGCAGSLASDVTPPPDYQPTRLVSTINPTDTAGLFPLLPPDPASGYQIYFEKCAPCHGISGMGDGSQAANLPDPPPPLGTLEFSSKVSPAFWFQSVTQGNIEKFMPGFAPLLSDRQRWDVVAYLLDLSIDADKTKNGRQLFIENCQKCHGENAAGITGKAPTLDREIVLQKSLNELSLIISQGKGKMPAVGKMLTETQQLELAAYIRSMVFADQSSKSGAQLTVVPTIIPVETGQPAFSENTDVVIAGKVVNGSGIGFSQGIQVDITGYDAMQNAFTATEKTEEDGSFSFSKVPSVSGQVYLISAHYKGIVYSSDLIYPDKPESLKNQIITVYETNTDISQVRADRLHLFFEFPDSNTIQVVQMYVLNNPTNYLIAADKPGVPVVNFPLPAGASNLEFQGGKLGERFIRTADGFGDTQGIPPGSGTQILFSYDLPYKTDLHLTVKVPMAVETSNIMLPSKGVNIRSIQLLDMGEKNIQGVTWRIYSSSMLATGTNLEMLLTGKPTVEKTEESEQKLNLTTGLIALGITLIITAIIGFRWFSARKIKPAVKSEIPLDGSSKDALLDAIITLDDLYKAGQIPRSAYFDRREELKDRLRGLNLTSD